MTLRVLVCDEIPIIRDGLNTLLDAEPDMDVIGTTDSGAHALVMARARHPHVVITGLALRGMSGLELVRRLSKEEFDYPVRVIVFAMSSSDEVITEALHAGASGLLTKDATREEIGSAIRAASRGQTMLAPQVAQRLVHWFLQKDPPRKGLSPITTALTPRERQVLALIADGLSTAEIARELSIGLTTVRTHLYRLRCKLAVRDRAQLVSFAYRAGLVH